MPKFPNGYIHLPDHTKWHE